MSERDSLGDPATGDAFIDDLDARFDILWGCAPLPMTSVAGTADAVTADVTPAIGGGGYTDGMLFSIVWAAANTITNFTLNSKAVVNFDGSALPVGAVDADLASILLFQDDEFRIMTPLAASNSETAYHYTITTTQTVTWPTGLDADTMVTVDAWGAGGGGSGNAGGGGAGYMMGRWRLGDLGVSTLCTIGTGGAPSTAGGNTTFGALMTAYGGGGAITTTPGGGGGSHAAGTAGGGGAIGGGTGAGANATTTEGGGSGGAGGGTAGGKSVRGGGGGGVSGGAGGVSIFGGNGGASGGAAGVAPGGGGGGGSGGGAGARGEIRIWIN